MLINLAMGCCPERKEGRKDEEHQHRHWCSFDDDDDDDDGDDLQPGVRAWVPSEVRERERETTVPAKSKKTLKSKSNKQSFNTYHCWQDL